MSFASVEGLGAPPEDQGDGKGGKEGEEEAGKGLWGIRGWRRLLPGIVGGAGEGGGL